jgi:hypothetical protein
MSAENLRMKELQCQFCVAVCVDEEAFLRDGCAILVGTATQPIGSKDSESHGA